MFPLSFVPGQGVTVFKKTAEYVISAVFALSAVLMAGVRDGPAPRARLLLIGSFVVTIASELVFTLYVSAYGYQNLIGHYLKLASFYLAYQALFATEVRARIALIEKLERSTAALKAGDLVRSASTSSSARRARLRSPATAWASSWPRSW